MFHSGDDLGAIVADIGTFATRIGFAGDDMPKAYLPSLIGISSNNNKKDYHFDISNFRQNFQIESPLRDGVIHDWELFEKLWEYSIKNYLKVDTVDTPVLLSEKPYNSSQTRQKTCELMFEKYHVPSLFISKDPVLTCYSMGKTTGLVIDAGANGTVITPVFDGWAEVKNTNRSFIGGRYLDAYTLSLLKTRAIDPLPLFRLIKTVTQDKRILVSQNPNIINVHPSYDALMKLEIARDIKESTCRMSENMLVDGDSRYTNIPMVPYELPDGTVIDLGIERLQVPEMLCDSCAENLFVNELSLLGCGINPQSSLFPQSFESIPKLACDSILKCEAEYHNQLLSNIVITGGCTKFEGTPDRLKNEIEHIVHSVSPNLRIKTMAAGPSERGLCTWLGGSIVASLGSFHEMWMTKQLYDEYGSALVDKKCP